MTVAKNKNRILKAIVAIFVIATSIFSQVTPISAQTTPKTSSSLPVVTVPKQTDGFTITPTRTDSSGHTHGYYLEIAPGSISENFAYIKNFANKTVHFSLYGANPTVSNTGSPAYMTRDQSQGGISTWIKFDQPEIDLSPGEEKSIRFLVSVPKNTPPGDYGAGITMEKGKINSNVPGISIATRMITQAKIKVTGESTAAVTMADAKSAAQTEPPLWTTYYFWISCVLFIISLVLLVWALLHEKKPKTAQPHRAAGHPAAKQAKRPAPKKTAVHTVRGKHGHGK